MSREAACSISSLSFDVRHLRYVNHKLTVRRSQPRHSNSQSTTTSSSPDHSLT